MSKKEQSPKNSIQSRQKTKEKMNSNIDEDKVPAQTMDFWQDFPKEVSTTQGKNKKSINLKNTQERAKTSEMKVRGRKRPNLMALNNDIKVDDLSNQLESRQIDLSQ